MCDDAQNQKSIGAALATSVFRFRQRIFYVYPLRSSFPGSFYPEYFDSDSITRFF
jgi:hypothetical protein